MYEKQHNTCDGFCDDKTLFLFGNWDSPVGLYKVNKFSIPPRLRIEFPKQSQITLWAPTRPWARLSKN